MHRYDNGPLLWEAILKRVPVGFLAVVAGGALRDYYLGLNPKDIDIFVALDNIDEFSKFIVEFDKVEDFSFRIRPPKSIEMYDAYRIGELVALAEGDGLGQKIGIGARKSLKESKEKLLETFDFDILKACFCLRDGLLLTPQFIRDLNSRTATYSALEPNNELRSWERFERFNTRNPGILTPQGFSMQRFNPS